MDLNDNSPPYLRQIASRSHDQPLVLVIGGGDRPVRQSASVCVRDMTLSLYAKFRANQWNIDTEL